MSDNTHIYIPLGTRCSAAFTIRDQVKKRVYSFPFDWIDIEPKNIIQFFDKKDDEIVQHLIRFFYAINRDSNYHPDGSHFAHEDFSTQQSFNETVVKYMRRFGRLFTALKKYDYIVFFTAIANPIYADTLFYQKLMETIIAKCPGKMVQFITVNLFDEQVQAPNLINLVVPLPKPIKECTGEDMHIWEVAMGLELKTNPLTKHLFI